MKKPFLMVVVGFLIVFLLDGGGQLSQKQPSVVEKEGLIQKLEEVVFADNYGVVVKILGQGSINKEMIDEYNLLHKASFCGHLKIVRLLIEYGASLDIRNKCDSTPLHLAVYGEHKKIVELLLKKGADPNVKNVCGYTPMHLAALGLCSKIVKLLLRHGSRGDVPDRIGDRPTDLAKGTLNDTTRAYKEIEELLSVPSVVTSPRKKEVFEDSSGSKN